jgi:hypothetical protein
LTYRVVHRRAPNSYRGFLVAGQIRHWRLVEASSCVDVDRVRDIFGRFRLVYSGMESFILSGRGEK